MVMQRFLFDRFPVLDWLPAYTFAKYTLPSERTWNTVKRF